jgi:hypothetical protein
MSPEVWPEADELHDAQPFDADGTAQIASSNCKAYLLTQRRVGDRPWKQLADLSDLTSTQRKCSSWGNRPGSSAAKGSRPSN